ncbi:MAG: hypothetical protein QM817_03025 [Archangium sp.]
MNHRLLTLVLLLSSAAFAREVETDDNGAKLEVSGFYKSLLSGVLLNPDTVAAVNAVSPTKIPDGGFLAAQLFRANAKIQFAHDVDLIVAWQLALSLATDPAFAGGATLSGTVGGTGSGARRRLADLPTPLGQGNVWRLDQNLDRFALKIGLPFGDLTIGRQVLSWGTGRVWNPTDVLSPFPPTVIDREVRRGFDAVRLAVPLGDTGQLDLLALPQQELSDTGGVARVQLNVLGWDGSLSAGKYVDDLVFGFDLVGDIGPIGVHAEGAYTLQLTNLKGGAPVGIGDHFFRGVIGAEWKPHEKIVLMAEYSFNGYGTTDPRKYVAILSSARVIRGEVFGAGQHQAALAGVFTVSDVLSTNVSLLGNLTDPSVMIIPSLEYSVTQTVLMRAGAYVPIGASQSEYGRSSFGAFAQVGVYLP